MSLQDRRVTAAIGEVVGAGVDLVLGVLPEPVRSGAERGQVERALGRWAETLLSRLVASGVVNVTARPGAAVTVAIRETLRRPGHDEDV